MIDAFENIGMILYHSIFPRASFYPEEKAADMFFWLCGKNMLDF